MENHRHPAEMTEPSPDSERLIKEFVGHWGLMARAWGINSTMGELFALLYITGTEWTADDLRNWLGVSRGNVSMNLRELLSWGVVHKVHRSGERRELFRAETDVWTLFRKILSERKRRELDPSLQRSRSCVQAGRGRPGLAGAEGSDRAVAQFFPADRCAGRAALVVAVRRPGRIQPDRRDDDAEAMSGQSTSRTNRRRVMEHAGRFV